MAQGTREFIAESYRLALDAGATKPEAVFLAAVAVPESYSSGGDRAVNPSSGACGRWQIHPPIANCSDPRVNAKVALHKLRTQGRGAWEAFSLGRHREFVPVARSTAKSAGPAGPRGPGKGPRLHRRVGLSPVGLTLVLHPGNDPDHQDHAHLEFQTSAQAVSFGRKLVARGWSVSEHSAFGGVAGNCNCDPHCGRAHCEDRALDVGRGPGTTDRAALISLGRSLEFGGGVVVGGAVPGRRGGRAPLPGAAAGREAAAGEQYALMRSTQQAQMATMGLPSIGGPAGPLLDTLDRLSPLWEHADNPISRAWDTATAPLRGLEAIGHALLWLTDPHNWLRASMMALGVVMMGGGIVLIAWDLVKENTPDEVKTGIEALAIFKGGPAGGTIARGVVGSKADTRKAATGAARSSWERRNVPPEEPGPTGSWDWTEGVIGAPPKGSFEYRRQARAESGRTRKGMAAERKRSSKAPLSRSMFLGNR